MAIIFDGKIVGLRYRQILEKVFSSIEDLFQCRDHQRLTKPPRTRQKIALIGRGDEFMQVRGLVHVQLPGAADREKTPSILRYRL